VSTGLDPELLRRALAWRDSDPDPQTRAELEAMIAAGAGIELGECLGAELDFGTAGLRGPVGPGPARMNRAVVLRAARALAEHFLDQPGASKEVVVGYDARTSSRSLAEAAAGVFLAAGLSVRWFERPVPTPLVAYAARVTAALGAIVITASHNPREDNGLKAYDRHALQLSSPADGDVERRRASLPGASEIPCCPLADAGVALVPFGPELEQAYLDELAASLPPVRGRAGPLRIAYTPLHGVGLSLARRALQQRGGFELDVVAEQAEPDGNFPTTPKPNPEEPGTLDLVLSLAARTHADLLLANDPDADRLAAGAARASGELVVLSGNELGALLADFVLSQAPAQPPPLLVTSVVSSPLLGQIAAAHGARFERTLTGFKWIWLAGMTLEAETGVRFAFGCEEALGYSIGQLVRDKDGIAAAAWLAELAARCRAQNRTLLDRLDDLHVRHGAWISAQRSLVRRGSNGVVAIRQMMDRLTADPPERLAGLRCSGTVDYRQGAEQRPRWLGPASLFELSFESSVRLLVRPSGTEPKLKLYADASEPVGSHEPAESARARASARAGAVIDEMVRLLERGA
jgi:phosphomannomutase